MGLLEALQRHTTMDGVARSLGLTTGTVVFFLGKLRSALNLLYRRVDYLHVADLHINDALYDILVSMANACSQDNIDCDFCPYKDRCVNLFSILAGEIHHKRMTFRQFVKYSRRFLELVDPPPVKEAQPEEAAEAMTLT